ncbi:glutathione S-transferase C-terminal-like protein [Auriculariales sp. MPI-PUGE-AT-0066]|nr:glutathione S-transferase C-terminal-like protein [Auriculariales sp. MPI-PUGE-AT-0066]
MPPIGTLYISSNNQTPGKVIRAVGVLTGTEFTSPSHYEHFETNKTPEFLAKFPYGKVPALELASGGTITEGIAIARYVALKAGNNQLLGKTPEEEAAVDQWQNFVYTELVPRGSRWAELYYLHEIPYSKKLEATLKQAGRVFNATAETVINQQKLKAIFGEPSYVEKIAPYTPPTKEDKKKKEEVTKA